jgi:hypothetical protein
MSLTYGYDLKDEDDMIAAPMQAIEILSRVVLPGAVLVNYIPFCTFLPVTQCVHVHSKICSVRYIPSWVPWFSYEPLAQIGKKLSKRIMNEPIDFVKNAMVCSDYVFEFMMIHVHRHDYSITVMRCRLWQTAIFMKLRIWLLQNVR